MNRRILVTLALAVASTFAAQGVQAATLPLHSHLFAMSSKPKMVKFSLRNDSASTIKLSVGSDSVDVEAGKTKALDLPVGTRITLSEATASQQAGTLVAQVSTDLKGVTIALKG